MKNALTILFLSILLVTCTGAALHSWHISELDTTAKIVHAVGNMSAACLCLLLFSLAWKFKTNHSELGNLSQKEKESATLSIILILSVVVVYGFLAAVLYTSWLKGDDLGFGPFYGYGHGHKLRLYQTYIRYMTWVSRTGDIISMLGRISETRWQVWLITPAFVVATPFAIASLFGKGYKYLATAKGIFFFWFCISTMVVSAGLYSGYWRIFWGYAAANTYLWPSICSIFWLSIIRSKNHFPRRTTRASIFYLAFIYLFSCYCGASLECLSPFLWLGSMVWIVRNFVISRTLDITHSTAIIGYSHGCYLLFSSPALHLRTLILTKTRPCDVSALSLEQLNHAVSNLSSEFIHSLQGFGGTEVVVLHGIPLHLRLYFIPHIVQKVINYSLPLQFVLVVLAGWLCVQSVRQKCYIWHLGIFLLIIVFSWLISFSYLGGAVPHTISFFPAIMVATVAACYAFIKLPAKTLFMHGILVLSIVAYSLYVIIPSYIEAKHLKKYDKAWIGFTQKQIKEGKKEITVPALFPYKPDDKLGLISPSVCIKGNATATHNTWAASCFRIESIKVEPCKYSDALNKNSHK